jgi:hypothetical protein
MKKYERVNPRTPITTTAKTLHTGIPAINSWTKNASTDTIDIPISG